MHIDLQSALSYMFARPIDDTRISTEFQLPGRGAFITYLISRNELTIDIRPVI